MSALITEAGQKLSASSAEANDKTSVPLTDAEYKLCAYALKCIEDTKELDVSSVVYTCIPDPFSVFLSVFHVCSGPGVSVLSVFFICSSGCPYAHIFPLWPIRVTQFSCP